LEDDAVCRVERVGDGLKVSSLKSIGSVAHDSIQWFADQEEPTRKSELVARIDFGQELDIVDVLAICYAMKANPKGKNYTLQRYNCYFLCLTVIVGLAQNIIEPRDISIFHGPGSHSGFGTRSRSVGSYINERLDAHAQRVSQLGLAQDGATAVYEKTKRVMKNVLQTTLLLYEEATQDSPPQYFGLNPYVKAFLVISFAMLLVVLFKLVPFIYLFLGPLLLAVWIPSLMAITLCIVTGTASSPDHQPAEVSPSTIGLSYLGCSIAAVLFAPRLSCFVVLGTIFWWLFVALVIALLFPTKPFHHIQAGLPKEDCYRAIEERISMYL
ncbi:hypothetical protein FRC09_019244, partial [Ceratobasidium sp. 395]